MKRKIIAALLLSLVLTGCINSSRKYEDNNLPAPQEEPCEIPSLSSEGNEN